MPCYKCGARQTDPVRGASPWKRAVRRDKQVLICPECQDVDWMEDSELDRCGTCGSTMLVVRLGEVECRECGMVRQAGSAAVEEPSEPVAPGLAEEVAAAVDRVLGGSRARLPR